jgi:hypothetical protein
MPFPGRDQKIKRGEKVRAVEEDLMLPFNSTEFNGRLGYQGWVGCAVRPIQYVSGRYVLYLHCMKLFLFLFPPKSID